MLGLPAQIFGGAPSQPIPSQDVNPGTIAAPTADQLQQQDMQEAGMQRLGSVGMLLMAAGQRMTPRERATILAQAPQYMDGMQRDAASAAQARLINMQGQAAQQEIARTQNLQSKLSDPAFLQSLNITPEIAQALGHSGIQKLLENQAMANTPEASLDRRYKQAQIDRLLNPTPADPQMVDLPSGGKGWAYPGKPDVLPIGGAGKGNLDPETVKRSDNENMDLTYAREAITANKFLSDPTYSGSLTDGYKNRLNKIPTLEGSWAGEKYLTGDSQSNSFVDSVVRPRSGAVVGDAEKADKKRIFTPMPGDTPQQLFEKAKMRTQHIQSLIAGANPADRPMLLKMFQDSENELQQAYSGNRAVSQAPQSSLPTGVRSITPIE
jgi:hypothetical protein